jgi:hypothetical protein
MLNYGFSNGNNEPTLYLKTNQQASILIVCLYVDNMIYTCDIMFNEFNVAMEKEFEMIDFGLLKYFLGIEVE